MNQQLLEKAAYRLKMLELLYDEVRGNTSIGLLLDKFLKHAFKNGIPQDQVNSAWQYLLNEGLVGSPRQGQVGITHEGVKEVERARTRPNDDTKHFSSTVIHNVFNINGPLNGIQTGSHNTMTVKQTDKRQSADLDVIFQALRSNIAALPDPVREDATIIANELEKQTRSDNPSIPIIKSYVGTLETNSSECGTNARAAMEWVLKNYCR